MASRVWASTMPAPVQHPSPSGPRCRSTAPMAMPRAFKAGKKRPLGSDRRAAAKPHMRLYLLLQDDVISCCGCRHVEHFASKPCGQLFYDLFANVDGFAWPDSRSRICPITLSGEVKATALPQRP